ncbi:MAG: SMC-Scp complex subunit ScpB [Syntrophomonadaceae bacterium]
MLARDDIKAAIEAILFWKADYVMLDDMAEAVGIAAPELKVIISELIADCRESRRGIEVIESAAGYVMVTKPKYHMILARMEKPSRRKLSPAALETLAIIAYNQPVTRAEIEKIRGVKSERAINTLLEKGIIEEAGYKPVIGKPLLYVTNNEFLRVFGLKSIDDLPKLKEEEPDGLRGRGKDQGSAG